MKSTIEQLSNDDRELLALLYDKPDWKVLRKLIDIERLELAKDAIDQKDIMDVRYYSGQAEGLKRLVETVDQNFKDLNKKSWYLSMW